MTTNTPPPSQASVEATFRNYSSKQAEGYAKGRGGYPPTLINFVMDHHRDTGGKTGIFLDVGCGPGNATRDLAPHFEIAFGTDAGDAMIKTATEIGGATATGAPIQFRVCPAEEIDEMKELEHGSVDMITSAVAAHWFDMPKFWAAAAKLLKPGGTVALWTGYPKYNRSLSPSAAKMRDIFEHFMKVVLEPYQTPGNRLANAGYVGLGMPWDDAVTAPFFERETFLRREWDGDSGVRERVGVPADRAQDPSFLLKRIHAFLETISPVTRWREAHPDLAGTDKDCVEVVMAEIREAFKDLNGLDEVGAVLASHAMVLLCIKRAK